MPIATVATTTPTQPVARVQRADALAREEPRRSTRNSTYHATKKPSPPDSGVSRS